MSMSGESEIGKKRRLPLWMSSAKAVVHNKESSLSSIIDEEDEEEKKRSPPKRGGTKGKGRGRIEKKKTTSQEEEEEEDDDFSICIQDDDLSLPDNNRIKKQVVKPKPKPSIRSHKDKPKRRRQLNDDEASMVVNEEDDDLDLTVDDLVTIAQEYVKADNGKDCDEGITTEPEPRKHSLATSLTSRDGSGKSIIGNDLLPSNTSLDLFLKPDQTKSRDQKHSASEEIIHNSSRTGDPAQDMLDLFLGPLLQKPQTTKEIRSEAVREEIELDIDSQIQSQREGLGKLVPVVGKKKTSLKDKVAMLLD